MAASGLIVTIKHQVALIRLHKTGAKWCVTTIFPLFIFYLQIADAAPTHKHLLFTVTASTEDQEFVASGRRGLQRANWKV